MLAGRRLDSPPPLNYPTGLALKRPSADVAQLVEHLICNQAVASSTLAVSSSDATSSVVMTPEREKQG